MKHRNDTKVVKMKIDEGASPEREVSPDKPAAKKVNSFLINVHLIVIKDKKTAPVKSLTTKNNV